MPWFAACDGDSCLRHSDCPSGTICSRGLCVTPPDAAPVELGPDLTLDGSRDGDTDLDQRPDNATSDVATDLLGDGGPDGSPDMLTDVGSPD